MRNLITYAYSLCIDTNFEMLPTKILLKISKEILQLGKSLVWSIIRRVYHYQWQRNSTISTLSTYDLEII